MDTIFPTPEKRARSLAPHTVAAGGTVRIPLELDMLTTEVGLHVVASNDFAAVAPTSVDVGRFIGSVQIETDTGQIMNVSGKALASLMRVTESGDVQRTKDVLQIGTSTSEFLIDVHFENEGALRDLLTALDNARFNNVTLVLTAASGDAGFIGGTATGILSLDVTPIIMGYPSLSGAGLDQSPDNVYGGVGELRHRITEQVRPNIVSSGKIPAMNLEVNNKTRFLMLIAEDFTGGSHVSYRDDIITDISLVVAGEQKRILTASQADFVVFADRGYTETGVVVLDFGDDENGFLSLLGQASAKVDVTVALPAGVVTANIYMVQDYSEA